jgi:hypothetical protein
MRLARFGCASVVIASVVAAIGPPGSASAARHSPAPCGSAVVNGVLPVWARDGFSDPKPRMAHVLGRSGSIVAILWADPLLSPRPVDHNNKILWVARTSAAYGDMYIRAQRMRGTALIGTPVARRVQGGPGPSIINMPAAGCWRFTLTWKHGKDTLDLAYDARP